MKESLLKLPPPLYSNSINNLDNELLVIEIIFQTAINTVDKPPHSHRSFSAGYMRLRGPI